MADFEKAINDAIAANEIPGCALMAINRDGTDALELFPAIFIPALTKATRHLQIRQNLWKYLDEP